MIKLKLPDLSSIKKEKALVNLNENYLSLPFYKNGKALSDSPCWGMTLKNAGSMRFRWAEKNENRLEKLELIRQESLLKTKPEICQVQLDHTKTVVKADLKSDVKFNIADGIVTENKALMPIVTIADCVALYLYDPDTESFGIVHSGWKGTGIVKNAIEKMESSFAAKRENILIAISAHIHSCCYIINQERADYFSENFGKSCIQKLEESDENYKKIISGWKNLKGSLYRLSLEKANLNILEKCSIKDENIVLLDECTCCNDNFGSNRRETMEGKPFTVQAAFVRW